MKHFQILIIGAGNAGISVAARLLRAKKGLSIGMIDPSEFHYYQPAWTLVGGGVFSAKKTKRQQSSVIPKKVEWIRDSVVSIDPEHNSLCTKSGHQYSYDYLVAAPGIQINWHEVKGLPETLGKNGVTSNYQFETAPYTYECIRSMKPGMTAIFTSPSTPLKCGGAPQKITYLAADYFRKKGLQGKVTVNFSSAGKVIFGIKKYADQLQKVVDKLQVQTNFQHDLVTVNGTEKTASFRVTAEDGSVTEVTRKFDMLHVTPPQSAPDFIARSPLANETGWLDVDKHSLRHNRYGNVFGIGDAIGTSNAKTGAAIRKQAPVLIKNLLSVMNNEVPAAVYNGYASCPIVTGYGRLILAEFDYDNNPTETFPFDQSKPRWSMWMLKKYILPWLYWNKILSGKM